MTSRQRVSSFFVLGQERRKNVVKSLRVERRLAKDLASIFDGQAGEFLSPDVERVPFDPRYKPDDDHIFEIKEFSLPEHIEVAVKSPDGVDPFVISKDDPINLRSVFASSYDHTSGAMTILVQRSNRSRVLEAGRSIFISNDTFHKLDEPGLTLDSELVAIFDTGSLLFRNFRAVNPIIDLKDYFVEATTEEVVGILKHPLFSAEDPDTLAQLCDMSMRRRVTYIKTSEILDKVNARKICSSLKSIFADIELSYTSRSGSEKVKLPSTKKDLKKLLNHLCEAYYFGNLTGSKYEANSHRPVT